MTTARLIRLGPIFDNVLINATGTSTSGVIELPRGGLESLLFKQASASAAGTGNVKIEYAVSEDGVTFGSFADETDILASSQTSYTTSEGVHAIAFPNPLARFIKLMLTGISANPADTRVTVHGQLREGG